MSKVLIRGSSEPPILLHAALKAAEIKGGQ